MLQGKTLQEAYDDFIITYSARKGLGAKTVKNKQHALDKLIPFLNGEPFTADTANAYAQHMFENGWTRPNSQMNVIKNLKAFVNFLYEYDYIEKSFSKRLIRPKVVMEREVLPTIDQTEEAIIAGTEPGEFDNTYHKKRKALMRFAMQFALRTGLRGNELINIRGKDLYIDKADPYSSKVFIKEAKGGIPQWQPLPTDMLDKLQQHLNDDFVFPVAIKTCNHLLRNGAKKIGLSNDINMHVHILRKVFGTTLSRYLTLTKVSSLMRHSSINVTQKFYITYGLSELGQDMNTNHPLIRVAIPADEDIRAFINNVAYPHFARNKNIRIKCEDDPTKGVFVVEFNYRNIDKTQVTW